MLSAQVGPQSIAIGEEDWVPLTVPLPILTMVSVLGTKATLTVRVWSIVTVQEMDPEQPPPEKMPMDPANGGVAVSVTGVPCTKLAAQVAPQLMPAGLLVTVPPPVTSMVSG